MYSREVLQFATEHAKEYTQEEMAEELNRRFNTEFTRAKIKNYYANHNLKAGKRRRTYSKTFPQEVCDFMEANQKGSLQEMVDKLRAEFGREYTVQQIKAYYANHGLRTGNTGQFQKGHVPWTKGKKWSDYMSPEAQEHSRRSAYEHAHIPDNLLPVGTIRKTRDGYLIIKVNERGTQWERWQMLNRVIWEEKNGPVPKGHVLIFKDGNRENCSLDNLLLATMAESQMMNRKNLRSTVPEITEVGHTLAKLTIATKKKRKEGPG